jgi:hypothetical protein
LGTIVEGNMFSITTHAERRTEVAAQPRETDIAGIIGFSHISDLACADIFDVNACLFFAGNQRALQVPSVLSVEPLKIYS